MAVPHMEGAFTSARTLEYIALSRTFAFLMCCIRQSILLSLLFLAYLPGASINGLAQDRITFNLKASHQFTGFGLQLWPQTDHRSERDALIRDLNVSWVRFSITPEIPEDQLKDHMSVNEILNVITKNEDQQQTEMVRQFQQELGALKVQTHLVFWQMPPPWCVSVHGSDGRERIHVEPGHISDFSNWIVAHLLYLKRFGIAPVAVELINEPDGASNTNYTPEEYDSLLCNVKANFEEHGIKAGIEGPGVSTGFTTAAYLQELERTGHISILQQLSWHDYDTTKRPEPAGFAGVPLSLLSQFHRLPIVITEFTSESPRWGRAPYDSGPEARTENNAASSADFGVSVGGEALKLIADGASQVSFWQAEDPSWSHDAFGLLDETGQRKPAATALQSFLQLLPKEARVVGPDKSLFGFAGVAFQTSKTVIVALANLTSSTRILQIECDGVGPARRNSAVRGFNSSGPMNDKASRLVRYSGGTLSVELGPRTILTMVMQ
jgi:hypothetical protein